MHLLDPEASPVEEAHEQLLVVLRDPISEGRLKVVLHHYALTVDHDELISTSRLQLVQMELQLQHRLIDLDLYPLRMLRMVVPGCNSL